jgi:hypothetical protein
MLVEIVNNESVEEMVKKMEGLVCKKMDLSIGSNGKPLQPTDWCDEIVSQGANRAAIK